MKTIFLLVNVLIAQLDLTTCFREKDELLTIRKRQFGIQENQGHEKSNETPLKFPRFANIPRYRNLRTPGFHYNDQHEHEQVLLVRESKKDLLRKLFINVVTRVNRKIACRRKKLIVDVFNLKGGYVKKSQHSHAHQHVRHNRNILVNNDEKVTEREISKKLLPLYIIFVLDSVCSGIALPALPFFVMGLGANALQLSAVISSNYLAQTFGCTVMGGISDRFGRRPVIMGCLCGSILSNIFISQSKKLHHIAFARIVGGIMGGMTPIAQSFVADVVPVDMRPKFIGRLQACIGAGFVVGPLVMVVLNKVFKMPTKNSFIIAALFPLVGLIVAIGLLHESKHLTSTKFTHDILDELTQTQGDAELSGMFSKDYMSSGKLEPIRRIKTLNSIKIQKGNIPPEVLLLAVNGFLLVYAFSIETIYAIFLKDNFGYGHATLSTLFAANGILVGLLQLVFMRHLVSFFGKHMLLVAGNSLLAVGMLGLSLMRNPVLHFMMFSVHIIGYSMADTALVSLISRYAGGSAQGRSLGLNQSTQSIARVISPLIAGYLYTNSEMLAKGLPPGSLPYIAGSIMPLIAITTPVVLYLRSVEKKKAKSSIDTNGDSSSSENN